jgi:hypothetical protein
MSECDEYRARAAECRQKAKNARGEDEKHSLLALADSWLQTAELHKILDHHARGAHAAAA